MAGELIVYGTFRGRFKTDQVLPIGSHDTFPKDLTHKVQVYSGTLEDTLFEHGYKPEKHRVLSSFVLSNVPNIEVRGNKGKDSPFHDTRVYDFTQLIIIKPVIERTFPMNGATYGEIIGMAYGKTAERPKISKLDPPDPPTLTGTNNNGDGNSGAIGNNGFNDHSQLGDLINRTQVGCGALFSGCIANFWRILGYLLLLLFLWWLIKSCSAMALENDCKERDHNQLILKENEKLRDSLKHIYEENLEEALANINKIYFYRNSAEIHDYSQGSNGSLNRLIYLMQVYKDKSFYLIGHYSGSGIENAGLNLDSMRATRIKDVLMYNGIASDRLQIINKAEKEPIDQAVIYPYMLPDYSLQYYNRNMRVEVKVKK
jgi:outer membrane protein OmpA-like peptidoglycan-associated protein